MKDNNSPARIIFGLMALLLALCTAVLCVTGIGKTGALMLGQPKEAQALLAEFAADLSAGDLNAASGLIYGNPDLSAGQTDGAAGILWQSFLGSLECSASGMIRTTSTGLSGALLLRRMDLNAAAEAVSGSAGTLAEQMEKGRKDARGPEGTYTQAFLNEVMNAAAGQVTPSLCEERIAVELVRDGDRWLILPGAELLRALSGGLN